MFYPGVLLSLMTQFGFLTLLIVHELNSITQPPFPLFHILCSWLIAQQQAKKQINEVTDASLQQGSHQLYTLYFPAKHFRACQLNPYPVLLGSIVLCSLGLMSLCHNLVRCLVGDLSSSITCTQDCTHQRLDKNQRAAITVEM